MVTSARALHDDPAGALVHHADEPLAPTGRHVLRSAFAAGDISGEHVAVACETLAALPGSLDDSVVAEAEAFLTDHAARHDPKELARLGRHLRHVLDSEETLADDEEHQRDQQVLEIRQRRDGGSDLRGSLGAELTAELLSQLQPLAAPRPAADGSRDRRTVGQRNADALAELLRRSAIAGTTPARHGSRATITITMALETLERRLGAPGANLDWSGPISAATARRLACDAHLVPVVLGSQGEPLDVGRASYPVTQAIWRALVARDGGCGFDDCGRPPGVDGGASPSALGGRRRDLGRELRPVLRLPPPQGPSRRLGRRARRRSHQRDPATLGRPRTPTETQHQPGARRRPRRPPEATGSRPAVTS